MQVCSSFMPLRCILLACAMILRDFMLVAFLLFLLEDNQDLGWGELINPILIPFMHDNCYVSLRFLLHLNPFSWVYTPFRGKHVFVLDFVGFFSFLRGKVC